MEVEGLNKSVKVVVKGNTLEVVEVVEVEVEVMGGLNKGVVVVVRGNKVML